MNLATEGAQSPGGPWGPRARGPIPGGEWPEWGPKGFPEGLQRGPMAMGGWWAHWHHRPPERLREAPVGPLAAWGSQPERPY